MFNQLIKINYNFFSIINYILVKQGSKVLSEQTTYIMPLFNVPQVGRELKHNSPNLLVNV